MAKFWAAARAYVGCVNTIRLAIVLRLRFAASIHADTFPPGLPLVPAILQSLLWVAFAACSSSARRHRFAALTGAPAGIHTHDLRTTYVAFVWLAFTSPWSFSRTCCRILGHDSMQESLSYQNVRLDGAGALQGSLGPLMECAAPGASGASGASAASSASASGTP